MSKISKAQHHIETSLKQLDPTELTIIDDSDEHLGHAEADSGKHFQVIITSAKFTGLSQLQQHRLVYQALGDLPTNGIHAISITTNTP